MYKFHSCHNNTHAQENIFLFGNNNFSTSCLPLWPSPLWSCSGGCWLVPRLSGRPSPGQSATSHIGDPATSAVFTQSFCFTQSSSVGLLLHCTSFLSGLTWILLLRPSTTAVDVKLEPHHPTNHPGLKLEFGRLLSLLLCSLHHHLNFSPLQLRQPQLRSAHLWSS